jgi:site-specific DNA-methyltransferase (adenine-specific)
MNNTLTAPSREESGRRKVVPMAEINLYLGCSLEAMKKMEDNTYDLAIVDPPYGIGETGEVSRNRIPGPQYKKKHWDKSPPPQEYFIELCRVSKNQIVWGANHFIDRIAISSPCWIVWDKMNGQCDFADCELAWTSFNSAVRQFRFRWAGMLQGDMKNKEKRIHPTQKPVALYSWILDKYAKKGMKILDTHLGSGSIALACYDHGLDLDAWEIDEEYHAGAVARFQEHSRQVKLF